MGRYTLTRHIRALPELPLGPVDRLLDRPFLERRPRTIANRELDRLVELVARLDR